jgi:hypothetical protein
LGFQAVRLQDLLEDEVLKGISKGKDGQSVLIKILPLYRPDGKLRLRGSFDGYLKFLEKTPALPPHCITTDTLSDCIDKVIAYYVDVEIKTADVIRGKFVLSDVLDDLRETMHRFLAEYNMPTTFEDGRSILDGLQECFPKPKGGQVDFCKIDSDKLMEFAEKLSSLDRGSFRERFFALLYSAYGFRVAQSIPGYVYKHKQPAYYYGIVEGCSYPLDLDVLSKAEHVPHQRLYLLLEKLDRYLRTGDLTNPLYSGITYPLTSNGLLIGMAYVDLNKLYAAKKVDGRDEAYFKEVFKIDSIMQKRLPEYAGRLHQAMESEVRSLLRQEFQNSPDVQALNPMTVLVKYLPYFIAFDLAALWKANNNKWDGPLAASSLNPSTGGYQFHDRDNGKTIAKLGAKPPAITPPDKLTSKVISERGTLIIPYERHQWALTLEPDASRPDLVERVFNLLSLIEIEHNAALERARARLAALRTAAVAIMGRNMSHNIGSHVQAYLSDPKIVSDITKGNLATHNAYLRERMDLIASLATTRPVWAMPYTFRALWSRFRSQAVLLQYLVASHNIRVTPPPGNKIKELKLLPSLQPQGAPKNGPWLEWMVDIPHSVIGEQALFAIFENVIRNAAKHNEDGKSLEISVKLEEEEDDTNHYKLVLSDNRQTTYEQFQEIQKSIKAELIDGNDQLLPNSWGYKEMRILAAFLRMQPSETAQSPAALFPPLLEAHLLDANGEVATKDASGGLRLSLRLLRPKWAMLVDESLKIEREGRRSVFEKAGIDVIGSVEDLRSHVSGGTRHRFIIVKLPSPQDQATKYLECLREHEDRLPYRLFFVGSADDIPSCWNSQARPLPKKVFNKITKQLNNQTLPLEIVAGLYESWVTQLLKDREAADTLDGVRLVLGFGVSTEKKAKSWSGLEKQQWFVEATDQLGKVNDGSVGGSAGAEELKQFVEDYRNRFGLGDKKQIIYVNDHINRTLLAEAQVSFASILGQTTGNCTPPLLYLECYETAGPTGAAIQNPPADHILQRLLALGLIEAALIPVVVVDERLSLWMKNINDKGTTYNALGRMGIHVVELANEQSPTLDKIENAAKAAVSCTQYGLSFLSLHQGIIDALGRADHSFTPSKVLEKVRTALPHTQIVIHSGRGVPGEFRSVPRARFVEYSNVALWVQAARSKLHLVQMLLALRREGDGPRDRGE